MRIGERHPQKPFKFYFKANKMNFKIDINLDDEEEAKAFWENYSPFRGRALANKLGFKGKGSAKAANALANYAINKTVACQQRKAGNIGAAIQYEEICDRIYNEDIRGKIESW